MKPLSTFLSCQQHLGQPLQSLTPFVMSQDDEEEKAEVERRAEREDKHVRHVNQCSGPRTSLHQQQPSRAHREATHPVARDQRLHAMT